ncbi:hypothetical protein [Chryseolinea lacunae]|uniref:Lipoprotein n=1 Tax=Chryseolinea lacunae TaxID=2801331 RepID=A0ABS1KP75_9BACT|nr:hypothetical protein [Chryseolinea lacunae]MBL0741269.1 hypothetical protein [Chryseolinea lacunae]
MKKTYFLLCLLLATSCSKDSDVDPDVNPAEELGYPHDWVFTKDESTQEQDPSVAKYTYIYTNLTAMFRKDILKSYPLKELVKEKHCLFHVAEIPCDGAKPCYSIQLVDDERLFLGAGPSTNKEEVHLFILHGEKIVPVGSPAYYIPTGEDYSMFYIHKMPDEKGVKTVAIECVGMPGWFISDTQPGFNYAANVMTLQHESSPEDAPKWQVRSVN